MRKSAEGAAKNSGYTITNIKNAIETATPKTLETLGLPALKSMFAGKLEKDVLEILRKQ